MFRRHNSEFLDLFSLKESVKDLESKSDRYITREELEMSEYKLQIFSSNGWYLQIDVLTQT